MGNAALTLDGAEALELALDVTDEERLEGEPVPEWNYLPDEEDLSHLLTEQDRECARLEAAKGVSGERERILAQVRRVEQVDGDIPIERLEAESARRAMHREEWEMNKLLTVRQIIYFCDQAVRKFFYVAMVQWSLAALLAGFSAAFSTCNSGPSTGIYLIPIGLMATTYYIDYLVVATIAATSQQIVEVTSWARTCKRASWQALEKCRPKSFMQIMEHGQVLKFLGAALVIDLCTDAMQPGQVQRCESDSADFSLQYQAAWQTIPEEAIVVQYIHLSTLFWMLLGLIFLAQGTYGCWQCYKATRFIREAREGNSKIDDIVDLISWLADVAEWAACLHSSKVFRELAGTLVEAKLVLDDQFKRGWKQRVDGEHKFAVLLGSIFRIVVLENMFSLFLTSAFMRLQFDDLSSLGLAKVMLSLAVASGGSLAKACEALKFTSNMKAVLARIPRGQPDHVYSTIDMGCQIVLAFLIAALTFFALRFGVLIAAAVGMAAMFVSLHLPGCTDVSKLVLKSIYTALIIFGMLTIVLVHVSFAFVCDSHFFSMVRMACLEKVDSK